MIEIWVQPVSSEASIEVQARQLHRTIRALQQRLTLRVGRSGAQAPRPVELELTLAQLGTLRVVHERGTLNLKELAEASNVSPPSASVMVERLAELELVTRETSSTDRRELRIRLTAEGRAAVEHREHELLLALSEMIERLGPDTARQWCEVYERIQELIDQESAAGAGSGAGVGI